MNLDQTVFSSSLHSIVSISSMLSGHTNAMDADGKSAKLFNWARITLYRTGGIVKTPLDLLADRDTINYRWGTFCTGNIAYLNDVGSRHASQKPIYISVCVYYVINGNKEHANTIDHPVVYDLVNCMKRFDVLRKFN